MKRFSIILFVCLVSAVTALAKPESKYSPENMKKIYDKKEVEITMRDGVKLFTSIYEPKDRSVQHPILMERTCYGVAPYGDRFKGFDGYAPYVDAGYILVFQDVRGKSMSEGEFEDIRPFIENKKFSREPAKNAGQTDEASDTYDTVEWLIHNTNNNGRVGQKGISYPGFYATMGALSGHPALKAVSPQAPVADWFHGDDAHHNGALMIAEMASFLPYFEYMASNKCVRAGVDPHSFRFPNLRSSDVYTDFLNIGTFSNLTAAYADSLSYLRTIREHPNWDEYWITHTVTEGHLHDVKPAVMIVGGFFDKEDCYGALATYKGIKEQSPETELYLVEGPWYHGAWSRGMKASWGKVYFGEEATTEYYMENIEYPFFAYYLEGKGEKPQTGARIFDSGTLSWSQYSEGWPLVEAAETTPFYLCADGSISTDKPAKDGIVSYVSDPSKPVPYRPQIESGISRDYMIDDQRFASTRPDVICFGTEPLTDALTLAGEIEVDLQVSLTTTDADFIVKVIDVFTDNFHWESTYQGYPMAGYQFMVRGDVMRGKYRESFSEPKAFTPGETTEVKFKMNDVAYTFQPGHRLMIQIQSTWFPVVDRNPQTFCDIYTCDESAYTASTISIHCEQGAPSCVKLPVVK